MEKKWAFIDGSAAKRHPFLGDITVDHLNGKKGDRFIKAIKHEDAKRSKDAAGKDIPGYKSWMDTHLVQK